MFRPLIIIATSLACLASGFGAVPAAWGQADYESTRLAEGLRQRQLFRLAITHCGQQLSRPELPPDEQVALVLELMKTHTAEAMVSTGAERRTSHHTPAP